MSKKAITKLQAIVIIVIIVVGGGIIGYLSMPKGPTVPKYVKIGAVLSLTGARAKYGAYYKDAYTLVTELYNKKGGLYIKEYNKRIPIKLIILDDGSDRDKTVKLVEHLIVDEKVVGLLSGCGTPMIYPQTSVVVKYTTPYVALSISTATYIENGKRRSPYLFGMLPMIKDLSITELNILKYYMDKGIINKKPLKIALIWEETPHGEDIKDGVLEMEKKYPDYFKVVLNEGVPLEVYEFESLLMKVRDSNADVFIADVHEPQFLAMHREYASLGLYGKQMFISYGIRGGEEEAKKEFGKYWNYLVYGTLWSLMPYPQVKEFLNLWKHYSKLPAEEIYAGIGYEAARTLYRGIEAAGSLDHDAIRKALQSIEITDSIFPGQKIKFDKFGINHFPYIVMQNMPDGKSHIIWPLDIAEQPLHLIAITSKTMGSSTQTTEEISNIFLNKNTSDQYSMVAFHDSYINIIKDDNTMINVSLSGALVQNSLLIYKKTYWCL